MIEDPASGAGCGDGVSRYLKSRIVAPVAAVVINVAFTGTDGANPVLTSSTAGG